VCVPCINRIKWIACVCLSVCFISETSGHISLGLLLASAVESDYLSGRLFDKVLGVRSMMGKIFFTIDFTYAAKYGLQAY